MKKTILILAILVVVSCTVSIITNQNPLPDTTSDPTESTSSQETTMPEVNTDSTIKISTDEYFELIDNTLKSCVEPEGYVVSRTSTLRMPYYEIECTATDIDTSNFKADALRIAESIYDLLLQHEYKCRSIFLPSHEIISITFRVVSCGKTTHGLTIQFDLTDIDRSKPFLENLKTPITP